MSRDDELAEAYTRIRPRLIRMAYTMVGTFTDAEDVVSDCWLRLSTADRRDPVLDIEAWAVVAVARRALDVFQSARIQRESYIGPWLPQPALETAPDPVDRVTLDETVSYALMVVLETLTPAERTAWVLHDVFDVPFTEIADVVGRRPDAVRQLAARARRHIVAATPRVDVDAAEHRRAVDAFLRAATNGDVDGLVAALDPAAVLTSDGAGRTGVARKPVRGADRVAGFLLRILATLPAGQTIVPTMVNGGSGFALLDGDRVVTIASISTSGGRIWRVDLLLAPGKLPIRLPTGKGRGA